MRKVADRLVLIGERDPRADSLFTIRTGDGLGLFSVKRGDNEVITLYDMRGRQISSSDPGHDLFHLERRVTKLEEDIKWKEV